MTRVRIREDCGNSPKNIFVQELTVAFAKGNSKFLMANTTGDIRWNVVGGQAIQGQDRFIAALEGKNNDPVLELVISELVCRKFSLGDPRSYP